MQPKILPILPDVQNHIANKQFVCVNQIKKYPRLLPIAGDKIFQALATETVYSTLNIHEPSWNHFFSSAARLPDNCKVER